MPAPLSSLIGRQQVVEEARAALSSARLLTLTGAGGVGKTRLAIEAATHARADFPGGVWWIELADLSDAGAVESMLVEVLGVRPLPGLGELDAAVGFLSERRALLVVDNCEHLVEEVARVAEALLRACPSLSILATSRVPVAIRGETRWGVPPLSLPSDDDLCDSDAARLFIDRAQRVDRSRRLNEDSAHAVAQICRRLEGVPLAIELAAARTRLLEPDALLGRLSRSLDALGTGAVDLPERQHTLRATVEWSVGLLEDTERSLLETLAVFVDGWTVEAAAQVAELDEDRALEVSEALARHSLIQLDSTDYGSRSRMLETVRVFVAERLAARPDVAEVGRRPLPGPGHPGRPAATGPRPGSLGRGAGDGGGQPGRRRGVVPRQRPRAAAPPVPGPVDVLGAAGPSG